MDIRKVMAEKLGTEGNTIAQHLYNYEAPEAPEVPEEPEEPGEGGGGESEDNPPAVNYFSASIQTSQAVDPSMTYEELYDLLSEGAPVYGGVYNESGRLYSISSFEISEGCIVLHFAEPIPDIAADVIYYLEADDAFADNYVLDFEDEDGSLTLVVPDNLADLYTAAQYAADMIGGANTTAYVGARVEIGGETVILKQGVASGDDYVEFEFRAIDKLVYEKTGIKLNADGTAIYGT